MIPNASPSAVGCNWLSIASNATLADGPTLRRIVPHWLRMLGSHLREIVIIVDRQPISGRIADLQVGQSCSEELEDAIRELEGRDTRVRFVELGSLDTETIQGRWFGKARPVRCQAGTPVLVFAAAVDQAQSNIILRCDSDMLFCERGWLLNDAIPSLQEGVDVYEPPRLKLSTAETVVSSRAFMVAKESLYGHLPLRHLRIDALRAVHRMCKGRPSWLALEQMMARGVEKGQLSHRIGRNAEWGFSLHGVKRAWIAAPWFGDVIRSIESGEIPTPQRESWDFHPKHWGIQLQ